MHVDVVGESENPLGNDVPLNLTGAAANGERAGKKIAVQPTGVFERSRSDTTSSTESGVFFAFAVVGVAEHSTGADEIACDLHHVLTVFVGENLANTRLGTRLFSA